MSGVPMPSVPRNRTERRMPTEKQKMIAGELYDPGDAELIRDRDAAQALMRAYAQTTVRDGAFRRELLERLLGEFGERAVVRPPLSVDYGYNIFLEDGAFLNYGCVILDICPVRIGRAAQLGPGVQIYAADHPREPEVRASGLELGKPVTIGANTWIGGQAIILPGVTVGDDAIIGAGSVVTRDVPAGATVVGNPARVTGKR